MSELEQITTPVTEPPPKTRPKITPQRVEELLEELSFLDVCELALGLARRMNGMMIKWNHPLVMVWVKHPPREKKPSKKASSKKASAR